MAFKIKYYRQAVIDAAKLQKDDPKAFNKLKKLELELAEHPRTGTGKPELMTEPGRKGQWSRRITQKHRLVYEIYDNEVVVIILSTYGHYDDK